MNVENPNMVGVFAGNSPVKKDLERRLAQWGLGLLQALQSGDLSIAQAERDLFNMDCYQEVRRRRLDRRLLEFMQWGMELEDVAELAPAGLKESYEQMAKLA